jgi:hypothetical protein
MQNIPLEEVYATIVAKPDPFTIRTKKLVDEFVVSDIHTDRSCEKETVLDNGRRAVMKGTYCASTFVGKLYKMNGPSENPLERYVLFVGVARQNPIDNRQDEDLAVEMAAENAMVNPIMTIKLPNAISGTDFARFVSPYLDTMPTKFILTSKQIKDKKESDLYKDWYDLIKSREEAASLLLYTEKIRPMLDAQIKYMYGE